MRTVEQLNNLRKVFFTTYGSLIYFCTDETINLAADRLQDIIDKNANWTWEIKIITADNFETNWSVITPEPKSPYCSIYTIKKSCQSLLKKYSEIVFILATAKEDPKLVFQFGS